MLPNSNNSSTREACQVLFVLSESKTVIKHVQRSNGKNYGTLTDFPHRITMQKVQVKNVTVQHVLQLT